MKKYLLIAMLLCTVLLGCENNIDAPNNEVGNITMTVDETKKFLAGGKWTGQMGDYNYEFEFEYLNPLETNFRYSISGKSVDLPASGYREYVIGELGNDKTFGYKDGYPYRGEEIFKFVIVNENEMLIKDTKRGGHAFALTRTR